MKTLLLITCLLLPGSVILAQDTASNKKWQLSGYVKDMESGVFENQFGNLAAHNLLHNRINIKWQPDSQFTTALEIRNRMFWGNGLPASLQDANEKIDASKTWTNTRHLIVHSKIDRLWLEWRRAKLNVRLGRQRIDWGITNIWNPNDLFNPYNFLDFDYEERPAADAAKLQYLFNDASHLEIAVSPSGKKNNTVAAARYFLRKGGYDLQIISGMYHDAFTIGFGWAGKLGNIAYKGEGQAFIRERDTLNLFNYSLQLDYTLGNNWHISGAVLHSTTGVSKPVNGWSKLSFQFLPQQMMPARWSFIVSTAKQFTPLFSGNVHLAFSPGVNLVIIYPSLKYKLRSSLDMDFVWQSFFLEWQKQLQAERQQLFLRLKWSF